MPPTSVGYRIRGFAASDTGRIRERNEDSFCVADLSLHSRREETGPFELESGTHGLLFAVADGMGGAAGGGTASKLGLQILAAELDKRVAARQGSDRDTLEELFEESIEAANRGIFTLAGRRHELSGMGTTLTAALELDGLVLIGQIGDSRAYLIRSGAICQLTRDQSLVARKVEFGELTSEEARHHPHRNILLQALGTHGEIYPTLGWTKAEPSDVLLLCSDGLHGLVEDREMVDVVGSVAEVEQAGQELVDLANKRGGPDNITVIAARFEAKP